MTPDERDRVVQMLPAEIPDAVFAPEGDAHRKAKTASLDGLERHFRRMGRKVYLSSELAVYYPGAPRIVPDVLAVLDVEPGDRMSWTVAREGKGLDFILEVHVAGDWRKDHEANVARYAELGIAEYFVFDRGHLRLRGYRLAGAEARTYQPILPQAGRYASQVLGLDLTIQEAKLRFWLGDAPLQEAEEMIGKLGGMLDEVLVHKEEAERQAEEAERRAGDLERQLADERRLRADAERLRTDAERLRTDAERRLAEALAEIERLRRGD
jgi:Uma2 family endonuclease